MSLPTRSAFAAWPGVTNPTGVPYQDGFAGIQGYFQQINKQGGVFGRQLKLVGKYDDQDA